MDKKNRNFLQMHGEKLVLLAALVVLLAVISHFIMRNPFAGSEQSIERLNQEIVRLEGKLRHDTLPSGIEIPPWGSFFASRADRDIVRITRFDRPLNLPGLAPELVEGMMDDHREVDFYLPSVPMPTGMVVRAGHALLGPDGFAVALTDEQQDRFTGDVRYVSVGATIDLQEWVDRLQDGPPARQIPPRLWGQLFGVAGVFLQRQTLDPVTGQWSQPEVVSLLPDQMAYVPAEFGGEALDFDDQLALETIQVIRANQDVIARPDFPSQIGGLAWLPPGSTEQVLTIQKQQELQRLRSQIQDKTEQIQRLQRQLGVSGTTTGGPREVPWQMADPGTRPGTAPAGRPTTTAAQEREQRLRQQLNQLLSERDDLQAERSALLGVATEPRSTGRMDMMSTWDDRYVGRMPIAREERPGTGLQRPDFARPDTPEAEVETDSLRVNVWAHDLTVEPGKTYRYRVIVSLINPLFYNDNLTETQRAQNFQRIAIAPMGEELDASPWSQPVSIEPKYQLFLVGTTDAQIGRFLVWTIADGRWQHGYFQHRSGDPIGGVAPIMTATGRRSMNFDSNIVMLDLLPDDTGVRRGAIRGALVAALEPGDQLQVVPLVDEQDDPAIRRLRALAEQEEARLGSAGQTSGVDR